MITSFISLLLLAEYNILFSGSQSVVVHYFIVNIPEKGPIPPMVSPLNVIINPIAIDILLLLKNRMAITACIDTYIPKAIPAKLKKNIFGTRV